MTLSFLNLRGEYVEEWRDEMDLWSRADALARLPDASDAPTLRLRCDLATCRMHQSSHH